MKTYDFGHLITTPPPKLPVGFGAWLANAAWTWAHPAAAQHVGMFAGSLLPYASWAPPKTNFEEMRL
jgi:hypothetical protein